MTAESPHIKVEFNRSAQHIVAWYALDQETLRKAQLWQGQQETTPTTQQFADWLDQNGGQLDRADGPAYIITSADGYRREAWYSNGRLDRDDGPAIIHTFADGRRYEAWYSNGQCDREDGPAFIITFADGSSREAWYSQGRFVKTETLASLSAIPGVTLCPPPANFRYLHSRQPGSTTPPGQETQKSVTHPG